MKKDLSISFVRLVAMLLIILCHMMQYLGIELAWWFNVGLQMFLFISGYLYGKKDKLEPLRFYAGRFKKILTDYYLFALIMIAVFLLLGRVRLDGVDIACFLLMRYRLPGLEPLWFIPYILICYLFTPMLLAVAKKIREKSDTACILSALGLLLAVDLTVEALLPAYNAAWFNCYVLGVLYSACEDRKKIRKIVVTAFFALGLLMNGVQIWIDYISDVSLGGLFAILHGKWSSYAHVLLGVCLVLVLRRVFTWLPRWRGVAMLLELSDRYSYDVYLVHPFFILGPHSVFILVGKAVPGALLALVLTAVSAVGLHALSTLCRKHIPFLK